MEHGQVSARALNSEEETPMVIKLDTSAGCEDQRRLKVISIGIIEIIMGTQEKWINLTLCTEVSLNLSLCSEVSLEDWTE